MRGAGPRAQKGYCSPTKFGGTDPQNAILVAGMAGRQPPTPSFLKNRHKLTGHVLSGRYKAQLVEGSGNGYLRTACDYVHLNPIRARLLTAEDRLERGRKGVGQ